MNEGEPFIRFDWILDNLDEIGQRLGEHVLMVVAAVSSASSSASGSR